MTKAIFLAIVAFLAVLTPLGAQDQSGSVAIAENIRSADESAIFFDFPGCVENLVKSSGTKEKDARKDCKEMAKIAAHTSTRIANEAADATKASRPVVVDNGYGRYGYGYGYSSYSSYRRPAVVYRTPARRVSHRTPVVRSAPTVRRTSAPSRRSSSK